MEPIRLNRDQLVILDNLPDPVVIYDLNESVRYVNDAFIRKFGWGRDEVIGTSNHFTPHGVRSGLTDVVMKLTGSDSFMTPDTQRVRKDGTIIDVQINTSLFLDENNRQVGSIVIMRDITIRKQAERAEQEQRNLAETLNEITTVLTSTLEFEEVLDFILVGVGRVVPHDLALVAILEDDVLNVVGCKDWTGQGYDKMLLRERVVIADMPHLSDMIANGMPVIVPDFSSYQRGVGLPNVQGLPGYIGAPIQRGAEFIGVVSLRSHQMDYFNDTHAVRLQTFANQAAIAILNTRQYEQAQELAAITERQRLARDLHDAVSQTLFSAKVMAETLQMQAHHQTVSPDDLVPALTRLSQLTQGALSEMRTLLLELRPDVLTNADLSEVLSHLVYGLTGRKANLDVTFEVNDHSQLPPEVQIAFYRIAQEAISNIIKHANATSVRVLLAREGETVALSIADDGVGFAVDGVRSGHFGLMNMRERASGVGGVLTINSTPGEGTTIRLEWQEVMHD